MSAGIVEYAICNAANERCRTPTHPYRLAVAYIYRAYDTKLYSPARHRYGRQSPLRSPQPGALDTVSRSSPCRSGLSGGVR